MSIRRRSPILVASRRIRVEMCFDGFKKSIGTRHVEKFSIQSGNATPAPLKNLSPPNSISILKMEEDSWGVWGWRYRTGRRKRNFESRWYAEFFDTSCPNRFLKSVNDKIISNSSGQNILFQQHHYQTQPHLKYASLYSA